MRLPAGPLPALQTSGLLTANVKHSAAEFNADAPPISTFEFAGQDYKELRQQVQLGGRSCTAQLQPD